MYLTTRPSMLWVLFPVVVLATLFSFGVQAEAPTPSAKPSVFIEPSQKQPLSKVSLASRLKACPALISGRVKARYLPPVRTDALCGDEAPLEMTAVGNVALKPAVQLNCRMVGAVADWVGDMQRSAVRVLKKELETVNTASSYVCRRRNNAPTGKFSEHATMNALDVAGFEFADNTVIKVQDDWEKDAISDSDAARFLRDIHQEACARFTTVLGPDSDEHHQNHFHLDLGCHGKNCTWRLCQ